MIHLDRPACPKPEQLASGNYKHPENKRALKDGCSDKCMYCESKIVHIDYGHVEHIKPKSKYPDLEFDWGNLGFSCPKCNNAKGDRFCEETPFINPYEDDPSEQIFFSGSVCFTRQGSERGELSIMELKLNRAALLQKRSERIGEIDRALKACFRSKNPVIRKAAIKQVIREAEPSNEYSSCIQSFLEAHDLPD